MTIGISVITCSLLYSLLLLVVYFKKERIKTTENKIYSILISINVFGLVLELLCTYFTYKYGSTEINNFLCILCNKTFISYLVTWEIIFTSYMFFISFGTNPKYKKFISQNTKKIMTFVIIMFFIMLFIAMYLPLYYHNKEGLVYSYGPATNFLVMMGMIFVLFDIICVFKNFKTVKHQKYIPLVILIILLTIAIIIRNINPGIILINSTFAFITALMYFTIENPDAQLISELYKNKKLIEKSNDDTSKLMFRINAELKKPAKEIMTISNEIKSMNNKEKILEANKLINNYSIQLDYLIDRVLNISTMDTQKIKIYENKYNSHNFFKEIAYRASEEIKEPVKFNYQFGDSIPQYLYGDVIKLKQAISSVLAISKENTITGFINLYVNSIIRYNFCRLIITIEDSGKGIGIDKINEILSVSGEKLDKIDVDNIEKNNLNILEVKKILNILGGSLMIKSEEGEGTTTTITLDQKIVETKETEITKRLENYEQTLYGDKKILVIDDDEQELNKIVKLIEKEDIEINSSLFGRDAIERIRNKQKYDLIILDDELTDINAINILQELQKIKSFKTPVVIMINDNKEGIKLQYLKDGFADTISKSKLEIEINRIIKRFEK